MRFLATFLFIYFIYIHEVHSQNSKGFLYGSVTLKNNQSYTGQLRWDNEAGAWDDLFEAYKNEPQIQEQIDIQGYEKNEDTGNDLFEFSFMKLWEDKESKNRFHFKCQFGHIDKIVDLKDNKYATAILKDGKKIKLRKRGNDIGEDIIMYHGSLGNLEFDWKNIKEIDFIATPGNLKNPTGNKIYGKVLTIDGPMEGYITWDFDEEAFETDVISGYHDKVEYDIEFGNIASLRPEREGSMITLKNGSELFMKGSSDVDKENDGIFIKTENSGMINLSWSNLIRIDFTKPGFKPPEYSAYGPPKLLYGKIETTENQSFTGQIAYDLDETWDIEPLDGISKGTKYYIPFYLINRISPQNYNYSLVELTNGSSMMLGEVGDLNHENNGILVWLTASKTKYIPWKQIKSVTFTTK